MRLKCDRSKNNNKYFKICVCFQVSAQKSRAGTPITFLQSGHCSCLMISAKQLSIWTMVGTEREKSMSKCGYSSWVGLDPGNIWDDDVILKNWVVILGLVRKMLPLQKGGNWKDLSCTCRIYNNTYINTQPASKSSPLQHHPHGMSIIPSCRCLVLVQEEVNSASAFTK